jgi:hypothetical protein
MAASRTGAWAGRCLTSAGVAVLTSRPGTTFGLLPVGALTGLSTDFDWPVGGETVSGFATGAPVVEPLSKPGRPFSSMGDDVDASWATGVGEVWMPLVWLRESAASASSYDGGDWSS